MSDGGWNDYVDPTSTGADDGASDGDNPTADLTAIDQTALADDIGTDLGDAESAADWASWNQATADEQSAAADSYLDDAATQLSEGNDTAAAQDLYDAGAQSDLAADHQSMADDYESQAYSSLGDAATDISTYDSTAVDSAAYDAADAAPVDTSTDSAE